MGIRYAGSSVPSVPRQRKAGEGRSFSSGPGRMKT